MIENRIVPNMNIFSNIHNSMPIDDFSKQGFGVSKLKETNSPDFKSVLAGMVSNLNNEIEKPDQLLNAQMAGNKEVDVHDIMTAVAKAEVGINLATQVTTKVVAAYNAVMNISI